jgi:hypothetical protein
MLSRVTRVPCHVRRRNRPFELLTLTRVERLCQKRTRFLIFPMNWVLLVLQFLRHMAIPSPELAPTRSEGVRGCPHQNFVPLSGTVFSRHFAVFCQLVLYN